MDHYFSEHNYTQEDQRARRRVSFSEIKRGEGCQAQEGKEQGQS